MVQELIESEMQKGFLCGPFDFPPFPVFRVSPLGMAYGKYSGKPRLIVDFSAPHDSGDHPSLNDLMSDYDFSLKYISIDEAISKIQSLGRRTILCKTDIKDAFKQLPVRKDLWPFQCVQFDNKYFFYTRLVFGSRSSPYIFDKLSQAITWIARFKYGIPHILHLLDDFISFSPPGSDGPKAMAKLLQVFNDLYIPLSENKTVGPSVRLEYLGLILDSNLMRCELPLDKVNRICEMIAGLETRHSVTKIELLRLLGHLNFAARVIPAGRPFVSHLLSIAHSVSQLHYHVYLDKDCRLELLLWREFLEHWNGVSVFLEAKVTPAQGMDLWTDSSGTLGFGGYHRGAWFQGRWPHEWFTNGVNTSGLSMAFLELFPIVVAIHLWGHKWSGKRILLHCDNQATVAIIRKGRSRVREINVLMRKLTLCTAKFNCLLLAEYIPTKENVIADALSRFQMSRFTQLAPAEADSVATPVPRSLTNILLTWNR